MKCWAIVPVKRLAAAKSRLAPVLSLRQRRALVRSLLIHTLAVLRAAHGINGILVVGKDRAVREIARKSGTDFVREGERDGLNRALMRAAADAAGRGAEAVMVLPADLPLLKSADIAWALKGAGRPPFFAIAPDRTERGTNLILMAPPGLIRFSFGERSFRRHVNAARRAGLKAAILRRPAFAEDIDRPEDLLKVQDLGWESLNL
jgi:2-phospho-L-lactate guanylyltransferase